VEDTIVSLGVFSRQQIERFSFPGFPLPSRAVNQFIMASTRDMDESEVSENDNVGEQEDERDDCGFAGYENTHGYELLSDELDEHGDVIDHDDDILEHDSRCQYHLFDSDGLDDQSARYARMAGVPPALAPPPPENQQESLESESRNFELDKSQIESIKAAMSSITLGPPSGSQHDIDDASIKRALERARSRQHDPDSSSI